MIRWANIIKYGTKTYFGWTGHGRSQMGHQRWWWKAMSMKMAGGTAAWFKLSWGKLELWQCWQNQSCSSQLWQCIQKRGMANTQQSRSKHHRRQAVDSELGYEDSDVNIQANPHTSQTSPKADILGPMPGGDDTMTSKISIDQPNKCTKLSQTPSNEDDNKQVSVEANQGTPMDAEVSMVSAKMTHVKSKCTKSSKGRKQPASISDDDESDIGKGTKAPPMKRQQYTLTSMTQLLNQVLLDEKHTAAAWMRASEAEHICEEARLARISKEAELMELNNHYTQKILDTLWLAKELGIVLTEITDPKDLPLNLIHSNPLNNTTVLVSQAPYNVAQATVPLQGQVSAFTPGFTNNTFTNMFQTDTLIFAPSGFSPSNTQPFGAFANSSFGAFATAGSFDTAPMNTVMMTSPDVEMNWL
ncbi:hypothetical protein EDD18DRAFT_1100520 [Armillaria luteobubalina]|uniref:Uncharacterized protein n=1 Tax=Armillaria luteobubalina TaxID=153913 RepID=A0AA39QI09_9AGAR|nr:hypothetical protein EDD18DRAFT_1100520 [Armillaria luteobubalina]